jgi:hypothetical protein
MLIKIRTVFICPPKNHRLEKIISCWAICKTNFLKEEFGQERSRKVVARDKVKAVFVQKIKDSFVGWLG